MFFLRVGGGVPVLLGEFEGDVLAVVVLLVELALELLVDALVLLAGEQVGRQLDQRERAQQPPLLRTQEPQERSEHYIDSLIANRSHHPTNHFRQRTPSKASSQPAANSTQEAITSA